MIMMKMVSKEILQITVHKTEKRSADVVFNDCNELIGMQLHFISHETTRRSMYIWPDVEDIYWSLASEKCKYKIL